jgi:hypothetical protein
VGSVHASGTGKFTNRGSIIRYLHFREEAHLEHVCSQSWAAEAPYMVSVGNHEVSELLEVDAPSNLASEHQERMALQAECHSPACEVRGLSPGTVPKPSIFRA